MCLSRMHDPPIPKFEWKTKEVREATHLLTIAWLGVFAFNTMDEGGLLGVEAV